MKMTRRLSLLTMVGILLTQFLITIVAPIDASANGRGFNTGYFHGKSAASADHYNVLEGGLPQSSVGTNKQAFLDYVYGRLLNSNEGGPCPGNGCDYVGAAYIIQTMRGGASGWDYGFPDTADVNNWAQKVNNPDIGLRWGTEGGAAGSLTTARFKNGQRDIAQVSGSTFGNTLTFYSISTGQVYYMIRESCANPLGNYPGLPNASTWDVTPSVSVDKTTVAIGQTITWTHTLKNNGPSPTPSNIGYRYQNSNGLGTGTGGDSVLPANTANGGTRSFTSTYVVQASDVGKDLCRSTSASPRAWNDSTRTTSAAACVNVPYNYTLTPTVTLNKSGIIEAPTSVDMVPKVTNSGPTNSRPTQWQLTRIDIMPGKPIPSPSGGPAPAVQPPCSFFAGSGSTCKWLQKGTSVFDSSSNVTGDALNNASEAIGDLAVGSKICFVMSVQPVSSISTNWSHSAPICLTVAKKPKVQILGGDLIVGRATSLNIARTSQVTTSTSFSSATNRYSGSWSEYAIIPSGTVRGMASGAMFVDGAASSDLCSLSVLTISNNTGTGCQSNAIGSYVSNSIAPNVASRFPITSNIPGTGVDLKDLATAQSYSISSPTLNISSTQPIGSTSAGKGKWIVINDPDATVTITSNINYTNAALSGIDDIPQVVIIANNIIIAADVTNVDAWLIATGTGSNGYINTCGAVPAGSPAGINSVNCGNPTGPDNTLTVNGPVMANKLYLYRTAGSGINADAGKPAEVFNLRGDAYLWASVYSSSTDRLSTISTKELPPRF